MAENEPASAPADLALERRVERIEGILAKLYAIVVGAMLVLGAALALTVQHPGEEEELWFSLLTFLKTFGEDSGSIEGSDMVLFVLFTTGFVGLLIVIGLVVLVVLPAVGARQLRGGMLKFARIVIILVMVGTGVILLLVLSILTRADHTVPSWGLLFLLLGVIALAPLLAPREDSIFSNRR